MRNDDHPAAPHLGQQQTAFAWWAAELMLDAERKGGRLLSTKIDPAKPGDNQWSSHAATTLKCLGITCTFVVNLNRLHDGDPTSKTGSAENPVLGKATFAEAGIDKAHANRAQKLAALPEE